MKRVFVMIAVIIIVAVLNGCKGHTTEKPYNDKDIIQKRDNEDNNMTKDSNTVQYNPSECTVWIANCEEYITLWTTPESDIITRIQKDEPMTLLGWKGVYARVSYEGVIGYVRSDYIRPSDVDFLTSCLDIIEITDTYSYGRMMEDIGIIAEKYPESVYVENIGKSELGRDIPAVCIGNKNASHHVLLQGAIHGREHMTAWLLMAMVDYWIDNDLAAYGDVCWHVIPMSNPDGVAISQNGELTQEQLIIYNTDCALGIFDDDLKTYTEQWKANGNGTDINRNFPAGWEYVNDFKNPSSAFYKGEEPFSASEAKALRDYTYKYEFDTTVSYHAMGSVIYWQYGDKQPVNDLSYELGTAVNAVTGYELIGSDSVDGAGYKDWVINSLEIPSLTIEIGCDNSPLNERELYSVFVRNYEVLPAIAQWVTR